MASDLQPSDELDVLADGHRRWLAAFAPFYLKSWEERLKVEYQAGISEAYVRRMLQENGVTVDPHEDPSIGGPDFRCSLGESDFYVDATCIRIDTAERKSGIKDSHLGPFYVKRMGMVRAVLDKCDKKKDQAKNSNGPFLLAVVTFHQAAALIGWDKELAQMVLTGEITGGQLINTEEWVPVGEPYNSTNCRLSAFLRVDNATGKIVYINPNISGILFCGKGQGRELGVLHPRPHCPFNPSLLPGIEFGEVEVADDSRQLTVHWPNGLD